MTFWGSVKETTVNSPVVFFKKKLDENSHLMRS